MKRLLTFAVLLIPFFCFCQTKQAENKCMLSGTVTYYANKYQGYKVDVGATVSIYNKKEIDAYDSLLFRKCREYFRLVSQREMAALYESVGHYDSEYKLTEKQKERFQYLTDSLFWDLFNALTKNNLIAEFVIGANGTYIGEIPYGDYYIIAKSANRTRHYKPEVLNRFEIERIILNRDTKIENIKFEM